MNRRELETILPHRSPMLLLDEASIDDEGNAIGVISIRGDEYFLQGHFPGDPVVPGVILCEMMAQTCAVLLREKTQGATPYYTGLDKVKFRRVVRPEDRVVFTCRIAKERPPFYFAEGKGYVDDQLCVEGSFSFALVASPERRGDDA